MATNSSQDACQAARIAKQVWLAKQPKDDTESRFALAAAQAGISMIGGVASLIKGIKAKTSKEDHVKYTLAIRNLTPFMLVFQSIWQAYKGEGVYPIIKPDETAEWVITQKNTTNSIRSGSGIIVSLSIVTDENDSALNTHGFYFEIKDEIADSLVKTVRLGAVTWKTDWTGWEYDPDNRASINILKGVFYTAPSGAYPAPLMVTAMPVSERREEIRLEITFLCAPPQ